MSTPTELASRRRPVDSTDVFCVILFAAILAKLLLSSYLSTPEVAAWATVFAATCVQSAPFLALGVLVSASIAVFVPPGFFQRVMPERTMLAVPLAGVAGAALPGCECGSVPVASALMRHGVAVGPSVAFLLSAPAINPVVLVATAVAFPGHPVIVLARFVASLATAVIVGWIWQRVGRDIPAPAGRDFTPETSSWQRAQHTAAHDLAQALGLLAIGAATAATLNVVVPRQWLAHLGGNALLGVATLSVLAVVLAVCSEADAFIAASLTQFSLTARLAFMVVGPAVDVKLIAMQIGTFGGRFALRFAPLTFAVATSAAALIGSMLL